jgi:transcriptional regulator with XRE-family HTH domain
MSLAAEIKSYRQRHDLTQREFGQRVGAKHPQESTWDWENGKTPRAEMLAKVRALLDADKTAEQANDTVEYHKEQIARLLRVPVDRVTISVTI